MRESFAQVAPCDFKATVHHEKHIYVTPLTPSDGLSDGLDGLAHFRLNVHTERVYEH